MENVEINITEAVEDVDITVTDLAELLNIDISDPGVRKQFRQAWVPPYNYIGISPKGTPENSAQWKIFRIQVAADGTVIRLSAVLVKWTDRLTIIYS